MDQKAPNPMRTSTNLIFDTPGWSDEKDEQPTRSETLSTMQALDFDFDEASIIYDLTIIMTITVFLC